jgi:hypothetical protein
MTRRLGVLAPVALLLKNAKIDHLFDLGPSAMGLAKRRKVHSDLARAMGEDATWVFLRQQADIHASRDRLGWTPRSDQWMLFQEATLK